MPISRLHTFVSNTSIVLNDLLGEISQLYRFLSGQLADRIILKQNSANTNLIISNTVGKLLELKQIETTRFSINQNQQIVIEPDVAVPPIQPVSLTKVVNLNAQYLDALPLSSFILNNTKHIENYFNLIIAGQASSTTDRANDYIVPAGTTMVIISFDILCDTIIDDSNVILELRKNGVIIGSARQLQGGTGGNDPGPQTVNVSVVENDIISLVITSITIDIHPIENIRVRVKFKQNLSS